MFKVYYINTVDGIKIYNEFVWMLQKQPRTGLTSFGIPQQEEKKRKKRESSSSSTMMVKYNRY